MFIFSRSLIPIIAFPPSNLNTKVLSKIPFTQRVNYDIMGDEAKCRTTTREKNVENFKRYLPLHLNILLFSFTGVFSKAASICYNRQGLASPGLYLFLFLMLANCFVYALAWQKVIRHFALNVAYANKSIYLIWSQLWAVVIFHESLEWHHILGLFIVFAGVLIVQRYEYPVSGEEEKAS